MNQNQYLKQKEKRILETIQKFREFGILTELELTRIKDKRAWVINYLNERAFVSLANLTGDFMLKEWGINLQGQKAGSTASDMKNLLIYSFRPVIMEFVKEGKLIKYNSRTYKVVKE